MGKFTQKANLVIFDKPEKADSIQNGIYNRKMQLILWNNQKISRRAQRFFKSFSKKKLLLGNHVMQLIQYAVTRIVGVFGHHFG